jgi:hypothetical protein
LLDFKEKILLLSPLLCLHFFLVLVQLSRAKRSIVDAFGEERGRRRAICFLHPFFRFLLGASGSYSILRLLETRGRGEGESETHNQPTPFKDDLFALLLLGTFFFRSRIRDALQRERRGSILRLCLCLLLALLLSVVLDFFYVM